MYFILYRIFSALDIKTKSKSDQSDTLTNQSSIFESILASISITNANVFFIADKKSMYIIINISINTIYT